MPASDTQVEFRGYVPRELYHEFNRLFPSYGAKSWFLREAIRSFLDKARQEPMTPIIISTAIAEMVDRTLTDQRSE